MMTDLQLEILDYEDTILAVKRGAAVLDAAYPEWVNGITLDELWMASAQSCVLGQSASGYTDSEYGDYFSVMNKLEADELIEDGTDGTAVDLGFCIPDDHDHGHQSSHHADMAWAELGQVWTRFITERRGY